jgi:heme oxygenase
LQITNWMDGAFRILTRLGTETALHHADADSDIDRFLFKTTTTREDYLTYLVRVYGFLAPLETALGDVDGMRHLVDVGARSKTGLLVSDLLALGMTLEQIAEIPQCLTVPSFKGPAAALGWLYIAERPTLAGPVLLRHVAMRLPAAAHAASRYLACYAGTVGTMWRELGQVMDLFATTNVLADRIVGAACEGFRSLNRWRMHDLQRASYLVA